MPTEDLPPETPVEPSSPAGRPAAAPRQFQVAGALVGVQGLAGVCFVVALAVSAVRGGNQPGVNVFGELGYFAVISAGVVASAAGLLLGRRWARTPAVVIQLILLGVAWYLVGSSGRPVIGAVVAVFCLAVLALLFSAPVRAWVAEELGGARRT